MSDNISELINNCGPSAVLCGIMFPLKGKMIVCKSCGNILDDMHFYSSAYTEKTGYRYPVCKGCIKKIRQEYSSTHRREINKIHRDYYSRNVEKERQRTNEWALKNKDMVIKRKLRFVLKHSSDLNIDINSIRFTSSFILKPKILQRDFYCCRCCGRDEQLKIHHIIPVSCVSNPSLIYSEYNMVTLCSDCHLYKAHDGYFRNLNFELALSFIKSNFDLYKITNFDSHMAIYLQQ